MLDDPTPVHFDSRDGSVTVDADGTVHLPVIVQGSTIDFKFFLEDDASGAVIDPATYTITAQWRKKVTSTDTEAAATATISGNELRVRVPAAEVAAMKAKSGVFGMEYEVNDGEADLHRHTFALGRYYLIQEPVR